MVTVVDQLRQAVVPPVSALQPPQMSAVRLFKGVVQLLHCLARPQDLCQSEPPLT